MSVSSGETEFDLILSVMYNSLERGRLIMRDRRKVLHEEDVKSLVQELMEIIEDYKAVKVAKVLGRRLFMSETDLIALNLRESEAERAEKKRINKMKASITRDVTKEVMRRIKDSKMDSFRGRKGGIREMTADQVEGIVASIVDEEMESLQEIQDRRRKISRERRTLFRKQSKEIRTLLTEFVDSHEALLSVFERLRRSGMDLPRTSMERDLDDIRDVLDREERL